MNRLYKCEWKLSGKTRRAVVRADNMAAAISFLREHYRGEGPSKDYNIGPCTERSASLLKCEKFNANQIAIPVP